MKKKGTVQNQDDGEPAKKSQGGCGVQQLTFTIEGMKIVRELYVVHCFDVMFLSISKALRLCLQSFKL